MGTVDHSIHQRSKNLALSSEVMEFLIALSTLCLLVFFFRIAKNGSPCQNNLGKIDGNINVVSERSTFQRYRLYCIWISCMHLKSGVVRTFTQVIKIKKQEVDPQLNILGLHSCTKLFNNLIMLEVYLELYLKHSFKV